MSLQCLFGHKWEGCICTVCGKTRDEGHDWSVNCERCIVCGKTRADAHKWVGCKCSVCGASRDTGHDWSEDCERCQICGLTRNDAHVYVNGVCKACHKMTELKRRFRGFINSRFLLLMKPGAGKEIWHPDPGFCFIYVVLQTEDEIISFNNSNTFITSQSGTKTLPLGVACPFDSVERMDAGAAPPMLIPVDKLKAKQRGPDSFAIVFSILVEDPPLSVTIDNEELLFEEYLDEKLDYVQWISCPKTDYETTQSGGKIELMKEAKLKSGATHAFRLEPSFAAQVFLQSQYSLSIIAYYDSSIGPVVLTRIPPDFVRKGKQLCNDDIIVHLKDKTQVTVDGIIVSLIGTEDFRPIYSVIDRFSISINNSMILQGGSIKGLTDYPGPYSVLDKHETKIALLVKGISSPDQLDFVQIGQWKTKNPPQTEIKNFESWGTHHDGSDDALEETLPDQVSQDTAYNDDVFVDELDEAIYQDDLDKVIAILDAGADPNARNRRNLSPLMIAVDLSMPNTISIVKELVEHGANLNEAEDQLGETILMSAIISKNEGVAKYLIDQGADVNAETKEGLTPLIFAANYGLENTFSRLVEHGADCRATTAKGWTVFDYLVSSQHVEWINFFEPSNRNKDLSIMPQLLSPSSQNQARIIEGYCVPEGILRTHNGSKLIAIQNGTGPILMSSNRLISNSTLAIFEIFRRDLSGSQLLLSEVNESDQGSQNFNYITYHTGQEQHIMGFLGIVNVTENGVSKSKLVVLEGGCYLLANGTFILSGSVKLDFPLTGLGSYLYPSSNPQADSLILVAVFKDKIDIDNVSGFKLFKVGGEGKGMRSVFMIDFEKPASETAGTESAQ